MLLASHATPSGEQERAARHPLGRPAVVDAGAGTGKTLTIVERVASLYERSICPPEHVLLLTFGNKAAAELRRRVATRLGTAVALPHCSTFHSFAWEILQDRAYDIGLSPDAVVIDDVEARLEFRNAFEEMLSEPSEPSLSAFALRRRDEIRDGLFAIAQGLKQRATSIDAFLATAIEAAERFSRISYRELRRPYKKKYKGQDYAVDARIDDEQLAAQTREEKERAEAAAALFRRFDVRLGLRHALTYADLLYRAEQALREHPSVGDELRRRYRCCIVDEYQDTDIGQHRFLEALFGRDLACVMAVGDVRQSIYGFRGAQPRNVERFRAAPNCALYPLTTNRRARQEILDFAHCVIEPAHPEALPLVAERGPAGEQVVHVWSRWTKDQATHLAPDQARVAEASTVASRIVELLESGRRVELAGAAEPLQPKHIAILSRNKTKVQPITEALITARVPFVLHGGVGFYDAPEILDTLAWLTLLANPFDQHALARVLASPPIGVDDATMTRLVLGMAGDESALARRVLVEPLPESIDADGRLRIERMRATLDSLEPCAVLALSPALEAVLDRCGLRISWARSGDPRAPQAAANLRKLETLARAFAEKNSGARAADFVRFVGELERIDYDEREADAPSPNAVSIMTIHAAKGLEWPYVFVVGVWPDLFDRSVVRLDESGALLCSEGSDGRRPFHYVSVARGADENGVIRAGGDQLQGDDLSDEERRLLYVGVTRARDELFVSGIRRRPSSASPEGRAHRFLSEALHSIGQRGWAVDDPQVTQRVLAARPTPSANGEPAVNLDERLGARVVQARTRALPPLSFSLIHAYEQCPRRASYRVGLGLPALARSRDSSSEDDVERAAFADLAEPESLVGAGEYGRLVHRALELWARDRALAVRVDGATSYLRRAARALAMRSSAAVAKAVAAVQEAIDQLSAWQPLHVEAPFLVDLGSEDDPLVVGGYIDLIATGGDGRPLIVDYKTGALDPREYSLQLSLYGYAARRAYSVTDPLCRIGRIGDDRFVLESAPLVDDDELFRRFAAAAAGLRRGDDTPKPDRRWCDACAYRAAPCQEFPRGSRR